MSKLYLGGAIMSRNPNSGRAQLAATALQAFRDEARDDGDERTLMLDLIADLGHLAATRKFDFARIIAKAVSVWAYECKDPNGIGASPQVTVTIQGHRPKRAWRGKGGAP